MKIARYYSHLNGYEWLRFTKPELWDEIVKVIESINADTFKTKISKEKTMIGKSVFSPSEINTAFKKSFEALGWSESRFEYWVTDNYELIQKTLILDANDQKIEIVEAGKVPIFSYNQTDFVKDRVAVEVQLGKYSFIAYDLFVKHMSFYIGNKIDLGVEILPMKIMQSSMSSGPGYYEKALYDLVRQGRGVPAVPLVLIGVVPDSMHIDEFEVS